MGQEGDGALDAAGHVDNIELQPFCLVQSDWRGRSCCRTGSGFMALALLLAASSALPLPFVLCVACDRHLVKELPE